MLSGKYETHGSVVGTPMDVTLNLNVNGTELTGDFTVLDEDGNTDTSELMAGKVDGDTFSFQVYIGSPVGKIRVKADGSVTGDTIDFKIKAPIGRAKFSGKYIG